MQVIHNASLFILEEPKKILFYLVFIRFTIRPTKICSAFWFFRVIDLRVNTADWVDILSQSFVPNNKIRVTIKISVAHLATLWPITLRWEDNNIVLKYVIVESGRLNGCELLDITCEMTRTPCHQDFASYNLWFRIICKHLFCFNTFAFIKLRVNTFLH